MVAEPTLEVERALFAHGAPCVIGLDEVGRGALAGPVMVGACAISPSATEFPLGLRDSKLLSAKRRIELDPLVREWGIIAVGSASAAEIDELGISWCLGLAGKRALATLFELGVPVGTAHALLDGSHDWLSPALASPIRVTTRVKADQDCASVSAASVAAKVERDALMTALAVEFADYGWDSNKGYGAAVHMDALKSVGVSIHHRRTWVKS